MMMSLLVIKVEILHKSKKVKSYSKKVQNWAMTLLEITKQEVLMHVGLILIILI